MLADLSPTRREILRILKTEGHATIPRLSAALGFAHESVRQQVIDLVNEGWITAFCSTDDTAEAAAGRPATDYCLTPAGDHFFPKNYDGLIVQMLDVSPDPLELAAAITDDRVARLRGRKRSDALRSIYYDGDAYTDVERRGSDLVLTERCCPYLNVALERPIICSTTVSTLRRVFGCEVVRERRFQDGDGRCEFHVKTGRPVPRNTPRFKIEPPKEIQ